MIDPSLTIESVLTLDERELILERVTRANPRLRGAMVADMLDMLDNGDAFIEVVEPMWDEHAAEMVAGSPGLWNMAAMAACVLHGTPSWEQVAAIYRRVDA